VLPVQKPKHLFLADSHDHAWRDRRGGPGSKPLTCQTCLAEEAPGPKHRDHGLFAGLRQHRQLDAARPDVHDVIAAIALDEDGLVSTDLDDRLGSSGRIEKRLRSEHARTSVGRRGLRRLSLIAQAELAAEKPGKFVDLLYTMRQPVPPRWHKLTLCQAISSDRTSTLRGVR